VRESRMKQTRRGAVATARAGAGEDGGDGNGPGRRVKSKKGRRRRDVWVPARSREGWDKGKKTLDWTGRRGTRRREVVREERWSWDGCWKPKVCRPAAASAWVWGAKALGQGVRPPLFRQSRQRAPSTGPTGTLTLTLRIGPSQRMSKGAAGPGGGSLWRRRAAWRNGPAHLCIV
jgi:hypothetical protein